MNKVSSRWVEFGLKVGLDMDRLKVWERQYHENGTRCWLEVMTYWINAGGTPDYPVKWEGLDQLLKDAQCGKAAEDLKKALASTVHHST